MRLLLTARDILEKKFNKNVKGYDAEEVDKFLDQVLNDYRMIDGVVEALNSQINSLKRDNDALKAQVREKDVEISLQKSKNALLNTGANGTLDSLELLQRCSKYEKKLYQMGVDPSKIK